MNELNISEHLRQNYEDYYDSGESEWRWLGARDKAANIQALCGDLSIRTVLDIGAGEGSILQRLSDLEFADEYYALDVSPTGVQAIENRAIPRLRECAVFGGYDIPYGSGRFDLAILSHVLEHVEYPRRLLYEASRVARYVFVEVPLEDTLRLPRDFVWNRVGHINFYSPKTIRRLLQSCNLTVLRQVTTNPSKEVYQFQKGAKGLVNFYVKHSLLKLVPSLATGIFTYHGAILGAGEDPGAADRPRTNV